VKFCPFFKFFLCTMQIALFWPKLLPALFLKKIWYPCPFEILEEALRSVKVEWPWIIIGNGRLYKISTSDEGTCPFLNFNVEWRSRSLPCQGQGADPRSSAGQFHYLQAVASIVPRSQMIRQLCEQDAARSKYEFSIAIMVFKRFSWNLKAVTGNGASCVIVMFLSEPCLTDLTHSASWFSVLWRQCNARLSQGPYHKMTQIFLKKKVLTNLNNPNYR
jgi:hypothetical protein